MDDWREVGLPLWVRFLAVGTPDPLKAAAAWLRSHGSASRHVLLADSIRWALTEASANRDPRALAALGVAGPQLELLRGGEPGVFMVLVDRIEKEIAAQAVGTTVSAIDDRIARIDTEWRQAAAPVPPGTQQSDHLDTVRMAGLLAEQLGPLQQQQAEEHLEACAACGERYIAWMELKADFERLPIPPPPPKKDYTVPAVLAIAGITATSLSGLAVLMFGTFSMDQVEKDQTWREQPAEVRLMQDGEPIVAPAATDSVVSVAIDPNHAPHAALVLRRDDSFEVLYTGAVAGDRAQLVPVDVIVGPQAEQSVYVVLGRAPIAEAAAIEAARGQVADGLSVAVTRVR